MSTVDRYLARWLAGGLLIAALVLLPLFAFLDLVEQLEDVGEGFYTAADAFLYVALIQPRRFAQLLPFIVLLGAVVGLGRLAAGNELTALRAAGFSAGRLGASVLKAGIALLVLLALVEQFVAPPLQQRAIAWRAERLGQSAELGEGLGIWTRDARHVLRVGDARHPRRLADIEIFRLDAEGLLSGHIRAAHAYIEEGGRWRLEDVLVRTVEGGEITARRSASLPWEPFLDPQEMAALTRPPESLSPTELSRYIRYLEATGQRADTWALALWKKAGAGLLTLAMPVLALTFSLAGRRLSLGTRLVLAAATGLAIFLLDQLAANAGLLLSLPPALTGVGPAALLLGASLWALRRYA